MIRTVAVLTLALAFPAGAFDLQQPVDCTLGDDCYIQQYFDHDPGAGAADFTCGPLSYDGHDGTDFALPTRAAMEDGVAALAAAPGKVARVRDGVADFAPVVAGRECGNAVVIEHADGWETQYCHLKNGSVAVSPGEMVQAGTPIGLIGQSGMADFPHLHLSVRQNGRTLDPFLLGDAACGAKADDLWADDLWADDLWADDLWADDLWAEDLLVEPGSLVGIGITTAVPTFDAIKAGLPSPDLPADAPALVVWAHLFGPRAGDIIRLSLVGPAGEIIAQDVVLEKTQAMAFRAIGKKLTTSGWPDGAYEGSAALIRDGARIDRMQIIVTLAP